MAARYGSISDELKAVFSEIATIVFADGSASGGPKISSVNGFWVEQTQPVDHNSLKDLMEKSFKATFAQVDFLFKVIYPLLISFLLIWYGFLVRV